MVKVVMVGIVAQLFARGESSGGGGDGVVLSSSRVVMIVIDMVSVLWVTFLVGRWMWWCMRKCCTCSLMLQVEV